MNHAVTTGTVGQLELTCLPVPSDVWFIRPSRFERRRSLVVVCSRPPGS